MNQTLSNDNKITEYKSCQMAANLFLNFNGRIDQNNDCLCLCCENLTDIPRSAFKDDPQKTLNDFFEMHSKLINECMNAAANDDTPNIYRKDCVNCSHFRLADWKISKKISYINLSMYPSPCQCRCIYCNAYKEMSAMKSHEAVQAYEKMFELLEFAKDNDLIASNAVWQISCGEITIHPYRQRIYELIEGKNVQFFTNCFIFDDTIACNLHDNPNSSINLSIDAGTSQTWSKVKGVNNFGTVTENLVKYYNASSRSGQITLKYIVLPGINDSLEDYKTLMEIMKIIKVTHLTISRDTNKKYGMDKSITINLIESAAMLVAYCYINGVTFDMFSYSADEKQKVLECAAAIIKRNADKSADK